MKLPFATLLCSSACLIRTTTASSGEDCIPISTPAPGWSCNDWDGSPPESHSKCAAAKLVGTQCDTDSNQVYWKCGEEGTEEISHEYEKGAIDIEFEVGGVDVTVTVGDSVDYKEGSTSTHTFGEGEGCGECVAWYMHGLYCSQVWTYESREPITEYRGLLGTFIIGYRCVEKTWTVHCTDKYGPSSHTCDRTNCDKTTTTTLPTPTSPTSTSSGGGGNPRTGGGGGDPHFFTWNDHRFSYHGECDLVLTSAPSFGDGKGLDVHVRTNNRDNDWDRISGVAVRIGEDVLEVGTRGKKTFFYYLNGKRDVELPFKLGGYEVIQTQYRCDGETQKCKDPFAFKILLDDDDDGENSILIVPYFKMLIHVTGSNDILGPTTGLMGTWEHNGVLARDGRRTLENLNNNRHYAEEWQVMEDDGLLFQEARYPQYPQKCILPKTSRASMLKKGNLRRLGGIKSVEKACSHVDGDKHDMCVYDVMEGGSLDFADDPLYF
eukprot:CAMPEP_0183751080 /NCGR_PEP_ID=MMETSP0739-20130205/1529_1 /TAXON_ID=385413 /ORGANISM="Thalassiosira miniscula, Strain CCMP1093" /LENGTH=490 /DNA_ID=CAMNT_0025987265 /DNA_START=129 /DNA_END=1601 /DNA_ORIENTATION=-